MIDVAQCIPTAQGGMTCSVPWWLLVALLVLVLQAAAMAGRR